jgi:CheY-like chemotaxis protein
VEHPGTAARRANEEASRTNAVACSSWRAAAGVTHRLRIRAWWLPPVSFESSSDSLRARIVAATFIVSAPTEPSRVLLVDDHPAVLRQVAQLLSGEFRVVGNLADGRELMPAIRDHHPDLLVLDISLPGASGIDLARQLADTPAAPKIVFLTVHEDPDYAREALETGALGYVVKSRLASDLIPALHAALEGKRFVSSTVSPLLSQG